jgi:hypothetical protein
MINFSPLEEGSSVNYELETLRIHLFASLISHLVKGSEKDESEIYWVEKISFSIPAKLFAPSQPSLLRAPFISFNVCNANKF